jgi:hypothetical protein
MDFAPIAFMSGQSGLNVSETIDLAWELFEQSHQRVSTGKLNRLFRKIVELRGPTSKTGQVAKVYYVAQTGVAPPTITLVVNFPELFTPNYQRFLLNRLRENSDFVERCPSASTSATRKRTLQSERGAEVEGGDDRFNPDATEDQLRKDALIGMRAAAREAVGSGADAYFDEPIPELRPAPTRSGPRVPRIDDDLDEAALERALAEMEVRALGSIEPEEGGDFPAAARDEDDASESDDQMDAEPPAEPTFTAPDEYEAEDQPRTTKGTSKPKASTKPAPQADRGRKPAPGPGSTLAAKPTAKPASKPAARKPSGKKPAAKPAAQPASKPASKSASKPASKLASRTSSRPAPKAGAAKKAAGSKAASRTSAPKKPGSKPAAAKKSAAAKSGKRR